MLCPQDMTDSRCALQQLTLLLNVDFNCSFGTLALLGEP